MQTFNESDVRKGNVSFEELDKYIEVVPAGSRCPNPSCDYNKNLVVARPLCRGCFDDAGISFEQYQKYIGLTPASKDERKEVAQKIWLQNTSNY